MRGDLLYNIFGRHRGRSNDMHFGAFRTLGEAQAEVAKLAAREMGGRNWAAAYHDLGFEIRTSIVDTDFELPSRPKPRDEYGVRGVGASESQTAPQVNVEVYRRVGAGNGAVTVSQVHTELRDVLDVRAVPAG